MLKTDYKFGEVFPLASQVEKNGTEVVFNEIMNNTNANFDNPSLGDIEGVPRVPDAGQCNDSYSLVRIALALRDALGLKDVNELPIVYNIAWYEQKAVIVLLTLLALGVKNIHSGPTLPAFFTPDIVKVLKEKFNIGTITTVEQDIATMIG